MHSVYIIVTTKLRCLIFMKSVSNLTLTPVEQIDLMLTLWCLHWRIFLLSFIVRYTLCCNFVEWDEASWQRLSLWCNLNVYR